MLATSFKSALASSRSTVTPAPVENSVSQSIWALYGRVQDVKRRLRKKPSLRLRFGGLDLPVARMAGRVFARDRIGMDQNLAQILVGLFALQILDFVLLDRAAIGLIRRFIVGRALVATIRRQGRRLLAPQIEIDVLHVVARRLVVGILLRQRRNAECQRHYTQKELAHRFIHQTI